MVEPERLATKNTLRLTVPQTALTHALKTVNKFAGTKGRFSQVSQLPATSCTNTALSSTFKQVYVTLCTTANMFSLRGSWKSRMKKLKSSVKKTLSKFINWSICVGLFVVVGTEKNSYLPDPLLFCFLQGLCFLHHPQDHRRLIVRYGIRLSPLKQ